MKIVFGSSSFNKICFASEDHKAVARLMKDGTIKVEVTRIRQTEKTALNLAGKVPFVRGIAMIIKALLSNKIMTMIFAVLVLYEIFLRRPPLFPPTTMNLLVDSGKALLVMLAAVLAVRPWIGKFHAAEHMVAEAYRNNRELSTESVMKEKRTSLNCGSIFAVIYFLLSIAVSALFPQMSRLLLVFACISVSFEIARLDDDNILMKPFVAVGLFVQKYFLTAQPDEKHVRVALAALDVIIRKSEV